MNATGRLNDDGHEVLEQTAQSLTGSADIAGAFRREQIASVDEIVAQVTALDGRRQTLEDLTHFAAQRRVVPVDVVLFDQSEEDGVDVQLSEDVDGGELVTEDEVGPGQTAQVLLLQRQDQRLVGVVERQLPLDAAVGRSTTGYFPSFRRQVAALSAFF